jgi:hypothetical protein
VTRASRLCWLLPGVPLVYLALILWLQPPDHFGFHPDKAPWLGRLVYDDFDVTAYAVRGLNARAGRTPGLEADWDQDIAAALDDPGRPLRERYYLEYPVPTLLLFRLGWDWQPDPHAPAAVYDAAYRALVLHAPRDEAERRLWSQVRRAGQTYLVLMAVCCAALIAVLLVGYEPGGAPDGGAFLAVLPAALYFGLNRFDALPALLTALSLACLGRRRVVASGALLAVAAMVKVYPVLLAPLVLRYLWPDRRAALAWAGAFAAAATALLLPSLLLFGGAAVWAPYHLQLTRAPFPPTAYGYLLPLVLGENNVWGQAFRLGALALALLLLLRRRPDDLPGLLCRGAVLLIVFVALPVFYSPQWVLWLVPLLAPLARRQRPVLGLAVALDLVTYLTFPVVMELDTDDIPFLGILRAPLKVAYEPLLAALVYARFAILAGLVLVLLWAERRLGHPCRQSNGGNLP